MLVYPSCDDNEKLIFFLKKKTDGHWQWENPDVCFFVAASFMRNYLT
jgi:hypothetical protein